MSSRHYLSAARVFAPTIPHNISCSTELLSHASRGETLQPVERALQDVGCRHAVDHLSAPLAGGAGLDEVAFDGGGRKPLVPEDHGDLDAGGKVAGEGPRRLGARALRAVGIDGKGDHQRADPMLFYRFLDALGVFG